MAKAGAKAMCSRADSMLLWDGPPAEAYRSAQLLILPGGSAGPSSPDAGPHVRKGANPSTNLSEDGVPIMKAEVRSTSNNPTNAQIPSCARRGGLGRTRIDRSRDANHQTKMAWRSWKPRQGPRREAWICEKNKHPNKKQTTKNKTAPTRRVTVTRG